MQGKIRFKPIYAKANYFFQGYFMILTQIIQSTKERVAKCQKELPLSVLREQAENLHKAKPYTRSFENALRVENRLSFICEIKKASPSKGVINETFPYLDIARAYEKAGANAISCLSEPQYFLGSDEIFTQVREICSIPMLRKDFTIDPYMIYQAKVMGADALLLIVSALDSVQLREFYALAESLGLCVLVETHTGKEIEQALDIDARIIGVNNRDLHTFSVDVQRSLELRPLVPESKVFVSESGISSVQDLRKLQEARVDSVLIGEWFMKAQESIAHIHALRD